MVMKPQLTGSANRVSVTDSSDGGLPKQRAGETSDSFRAEYPQHRRRTLDLYSVTAMEERYAIRNEGIF